MTNNDAILSELLSRTQNVFKLENFCFDKQLAFIQDESPFKTAVCSRRAGKTVACAADLIFAALSRPGIVCLYVTLSRNNAKKIIWPELVKINRDYNLGGFLNETELSIKFPNESVIYCSGAKDKTEIEKFRGLPLFKVYIDECQSFRSHIQNLVDDVISKALFDYSGTLCLIGTPGPTPAGYFYDCSHSPEWSSHAWTMFDNPWLERKSGKSVQELLDRELKRKGVDESDPTIQRECFGKWVSDDNAMVFRYSASRNHYDELPVFDKKWEYIIGVDIGYDDADAISVIAWNERTPNAYLVHEEENRGQTITQLAQSLERLIEQFEPLRIVMDTGGLGKKIAEEIRKRYSIPVVAAEKARKFEYIEILNDALRSGRFFAKKDSRFAEDACLVEWDRENKEKLKISDKYHSDVCFVAGTLIWTSAGNVPIENICSGDMVLTRHGYRRVVASAETHPNAPLVQLTFSNGAILRCTPSHPIYTSNRGFASADSLLYSDRFVSVPACESKPLNLKVLPSVGTQTVRQAGNTTQQSGGGILQTYTELFGKPRLVPSLRGFTSTIRTAIGRITSCLISNASQRASIGKSTDMNLLPVRSGGTSLALAIGGMSRTRAHGEVRTEKRNGLRARYAEKATGWIRWLLRERNLKESARENVSPKNEEIPAWMTSENFAKNATNHSPPTNIPELDSAVSLVRLPCPIGNGTVYNLTVEDKHEYFANGILVSNCDSTLYGFREVLHWLYKEEEKKPLHNTPEWFKLEESHIEKTLQNELYIKKQEEQDLLGDSETWDWE